MKKLLLYAAAALCFNYGSAHAQVSPNDQVNTVIDGSGQIAVAATSQQVFGPANRKYLFCQNPSTTLSGVAAESIFINLGVAATTTGTSYEIINGGTLQFSASAIPSTSVNVIAATVAHKFVCKQGF